ncbi:MAG: hypothetical protein ACRDSP_22805 [Pseudonocardiaceae bacterium]
MIHTRPRPKRSTRPPHPPENDHDPPGYQHDQARLDAEAVTRWQTIVANWPPLSEDQIHTIATVLHRLDTHTPPATLPTPRDNEPPR